MNNFEKIKNMTLDEMTEWLTNWCKIFADRVYQSQVLMLGYADFTKDEYKKVTKQWLQQEVSE